MVSVRLSLYEQREAKWCHPSRHFRGSTPRMLTVGSIFQNRTATRQNAISDARKESWGQPALMILLIGKDKPTFFVGFFVSVKIDLSKVIF